MSSPMPEAPPGGARASASPPTLLAGSASPSPGGAPLQQAESTPQHGGGVLLSADLGGDRAWTLEHQQQQHHNHLTPSRERVGRGSEGLGAIAHHQQQRKTPHGHAAASMRSSGTPFGFTPSRTPGMRYGVQLGASATSPANHPVGPSSEASAHRFLKTPGGAVRDFGGSYKTPGSSGKFPRHELSAMGSLAISARVSRSNTQSPSWCHSLPSLSSDSLRSPVNVPLWWSIPRHFFHVS